MLEVFLRQNNESKPEARGVPQHRKAQNNEIKPEARDVPQHRKFDEHPGDEEDDHAVGPNIVNGGDGVEVDALEVRRITMRMRQGGLEGDGPELEGDTLGGEMGLSVGGNGDTRGYGDHVSNGLGAEGVLAEGNGDGADSDEHKGLTHLDEGDGEVDVSRVGESEGKGIEGSNGEDGGEVDVAGHGWREVENIEEVGKEETEGGAEVHAVEGEGDGERPVVELAIEDVFVEDDDREGEEDLD